MNRVPRLAPEEARRVAAEADIPAYMADLSVFRVLLANPPVAAALHKLLSTLLWNGTLDVRLRELIIMRIGWVTGSVYEWTQHWRVAAQLGVPAEDVLAVRDWRSSDRFGATERAVLQATDETLDVGTISAETWAACAEAFAGNDAQLVELVVAIGNWRLFSSMLRSLDVPLEEGTDPWPPDGRHPPTTTPQTHDPRRR